MITSNLISFSLIGSTCASKKERHLHFQSNTTVVQCTYRAYLDYQIYIYPLILYTTQAILLNIKALVSTYAAKEFQNTYIRMSSGLRIVNHSRSKSTALL